VIDEYTIFGPKLGDRLSSFLGVSLSEHLVVSVGICTAPRVQILDFALA
jgi:hypothetical protein